jgi:putative aldouronate transport system substrate-binding protein
MKKVVSLLLCLFILTTFVVSASAITSVPIKSLKADKASLTLDVGAFYNLAVTYTPVNTTQKLLTFSSTNTNVASIDANGKITGTGAGKAVITVVSKSNAAISAKVNVTINKKKPVVLRVEVYDRGNAGGTPADNNYWTKWIQANYGDKNNVTLKFETSPRFDSNAKLQMWMAAGTAPDLCYTYEPDPVLGFYNAGGLTDLKPSLDKYGAQLKEFLGPEILKKGYDSKKDVQYLVRAKVAVDAQIATWIRKDWLDKLGMKEPTTTAEFYNVMKAFKEKNPDHMGKVVPFGLTFDVGWVALPLIESFKTDRSDMALFMTNNRWMQIFAPGVKDALKFMNKMYNEGLISKEFPLDTQSKINDSDIISGYTGCFAGNFPYPLAANPGLLSNLQAKKPDAELVPIDPFTDVKTGKHTKRMGDPFGIQMFVPKTSEKKVDEAVKYLNWMTNIDVLSFLQYGEEGKNHSMVNGIPQIIAAKGETIQNSGFNIDYTMVVNGVIGKNKEDTLKRNSMSVIPAYQPLYIQAVKAATTDAYYPPEQKFNETTAADGKYGNNIVVKANQVYATTITCKPEDFESVWTQQTQSMLKAGASDMLTERKALWKQYYPDKK